MAEKEVIQGNFLYTKDKDSFEIHEKSFLVIENKRIVGLFDHLPQQDQNLPRTDYHDAIIIPSFIDLHIHAPQYLQRGIGLDLQLVDWLEQYTFHSEMKFSDQNYARSVYAAFAQDLYDNGSLRSCVFGTIHNKSNQILVEAMKSQHISAYIGKVNMNQNGPKDLLQTTEESYQETIDFIEHNEDSLVKPIITPRFAPSCSELLLKKLGALSQERHVPVQTHLAENKEEVAWVKELFPQYKNYSDVYFQNQLYGKEKTIMAHAIYLNDDEVKMAVNKNLYLAHCPNANLNLSSGIMAVTKYLDEGIHVGIGSDVGAGHSMSMAQCITSAIQCSKMRQLMYPKERVLSESEAFYMATKLNGSFFGKTGSFEAGFLFDALVISDPLYSLQSFTPHEKLERFLYCGGKENIIARYLEGTRI